MKYIKFFENIAEDYSKYIYYISLEIKDEIYDFNDLISKAKVIQNFFDNYPKRNKNKVSYKKLDYKICYPNSKKLVFILSEHDYIWIIEGERIKITWKPFFLKFNNLLLNKSRIDQIKASEIPFNNLDLLLSTKQYNL